MKDKEVATFESGFLLCTDMECDLDSSVFEESSVVSADLEFTDWSYTLPDEDTAADLITIEDLLKKIFGWDLFCNFLQQGSSRLLLQLLNLR